MALFQFSPLCGIWHEQSWLGDENLNEHSIHNIFNNLKIFSMLSPFKYSITCDLDAPNNYLEMNSSKTAVIVNVDLYLCNFQSSIKFTLEAWITQPVCE